MTALLLLLAVQAFSMDIKQAPAAVQLQAEQTFISLDGADEDTLPDNSATKTRVFFVSASTRTNVGWVATSSDTVTIQIPGLYDCQAQGAIQATANVAVLRIWLNHNGASVGNGLVDPISNGTSSVSTRRYIQASANDIITVDMAASGATPIMEGDADRTFLQCLRVR